MQENEKQADLIAALTSRGVRAVSTLVADGHRLSFGGFDLESVLGQAPPTRAARRRGIPTADTLEARIKDGVIICHGTFAGGAEFGCTEDVGWISLFGLDIEILKGFRGPLRDLIDNPLLAQREYRVTGGGSAAGTTVFRFDSPTIPLAELGRSV